MQGERWISDFEIVVEQAKDGSWTYLCRNMLPVEDGAAPPQLPVPRVAGFASKEYAVHAAEDAIQAAKR